MADDGIKLTEYGEKLKATLKEIDGLCAFVGFQDRSGKYEKGKNPASVAQVAMFNEYGTENMPARPFMRNTLEKHSDELKDFSTNVVLKGVMNGDDAKTAMNKMGSYTKGLMQREIRDGEYAPNAPSTIRKKKSSHPLIDTGRMRQSVVYEVRKEE